MKNLVNLLYLFFYLLCGGVAFASNGKPASSAGSKTRVYAAETIHQNKYGLNHNILNIQNDFVFTIEDGDEDTEDGKQESEARNALTVFCSFFSYSSPNLYKDTFRYDKQILSVNSPLYILQRALRI
jgi:hypothetical protein